MTWFHSEDGRRQSPPEEGGHAPAVGAIFELPVDAVVPDPGQPRRAKFDEGSIEELRASIARVGQLQPIVVRPHPDGGGRHALVAGERRLRASALLPSRTVLAVLAEGEMADDPFERLLAQTHENDSREGLTDIELAEAWKRLRDARGLTGKQLAKEVATSEGRVSRILNLLRLPETVRSLVAEKKLSASSADLLHQLEDDSDIEEAARKIVEDSIPRSKVPALVEGIVRARHRPEVAPAEEVPADRKEPESKPKRGRPKEHRLGTSVHSIKARFSSAEPISNRQFRETVFALYEVASRAGDNDEPAELPDRVEPTTPDRG